jgi:hypothetical protein
MAVPYLSDNQRRSLAQAFRDAGLFSDTRDWAIMDTVGHILDTADYIESHNALRFVKGLPPEPKDKDVLFWTAEDGHSVCKTRKQVVEIKEAVQKIARNVIGCELSDWPRGYISFEY